MAADISSAGPDATPLRLPRGFPRVDAGKRHRLALVLDPRFPGGTSTSVAAEIRALAGLVDLSVIGLETAMFKDGPVNPKVTAALDDTGLEMVWDPPVVHADTVAFHNPSCLKFDTGLATRISCDTAFVITRENLLRPNGSEGFDVAGCLARIERTLVCRQRYLAPVSPHNRRGVEEWLARTGADWDVAHFNWVHICDLEMKTPTPYPRDRRGRHSRPGFEKFPPLSKMLAHFPPAAERCAILGGDSFLLDPESLPGHWDVLRFGEADVGEFLESIDFFVYFTHPNWRESFGWVIAEAIAAGKVVITDPGTAGAFGDAVVTSDGCDVDKTIAGFVADPGRYDAFVRAAQDHLAGLRPEVFAREVLPQILSERAPLNALH